MILVRAGLVPALTTNIIFTGDHKGRPYRIYV